MRRFLMSIALLTALLFQARLASADEPSPQAVTEARTAYAEGQTLFKAANYEQAQKAFERAYAAVDNPVVLLSIAECQVRQKQLVNALATFTRYLEKRPDAPDAARVREQIAQIKATPGRIRIDSMPKIAAIAVDGIDLDKLTPAEIELKPGVHTITLLARGYLPADQRVTVTIGSTQELVIDFDQLEKGHMKPSGRKADASMSDDIDDSDVRISARTWVAAGIAVGAAGTAAALSAIALRDDEPRSNVKSTKDENLAVAADISAGIAAAAVVTTVVLYLNDDESSSSERSPKRMLVMSPHVTTTEGGLISSLRF